MFGTGSSFRKEPTNGPLSSRIVVPDFSALKREFWPPRRL
jgi:hypothetical protein